MYISSEDKKKKIRTYAFLFAIISSILLSIIKLIVGFMTNSLSIIAMGIDSFLDVIFTNLNFFAVRISEKPADKDHPLGHGKFEDVSTLLQSIVIILVGLYIFGMAIKGLFFDSSISSTSEQGINFGSLAIIVMTISTLGSILISIVLRVAGKKTDSSAMIADSLHYTTDIVSNGSILVGIILAKYLNILWMDNVLSLFFSLFIIYSAGNLFLNSLKILTDSNIPEELERKIKDILENNKGIMLDYHNFFAVRSGSHYMISLHIKTCRFMSLELAHNGVDKIEKLIESNVPNSIVTIHIDPCEHKDEQSTDCIRVNNIIKEYKGNSNV